MKKRTFCALLALMLALSVLPVPAFAADTVKINKTNFPDAGFRSYVKSELDTDHNGTLSGKEIAAIVTLTVSNKGIASLQGIEFFIKLEELDCSDNLLKTLDLSKNTNLKKLYCTDNALTKLVITRNTKLQELNCRGNRLKTLDVSKNKALTMIHCYFNDLTKLDVSKNTKLKELDCDGNDIETLDIGKNPYLIRAYLKGARNESSYDGFAYIEYSYDGSFYLCVDPTTTITGYQPKITAQPKDQAVQPGKRATFSVTAKGEFLEYQWYYKEADQTEWKQFIGETDSSVSIDALDDMDGCRFYCTVTVNGERETITLDSEEATLSFMTLPQITSQPGNASAAAGKKATFKLKASGGALKYQWYVMKTGTKKWAKLSGKTTAKLTVTAKKSMNGYKYRCLVRNEMGKVFSKTVKLKVK